MRPDRTTHGHPQIVFAGGGTGGHILPALAIAERARTLDPAVGVRVLCSDRPVDARVLRDADVDFTPLPARPPVMRPLAMARFVGSWVPSVRAAGRALDAHASLGPVALVAMGGFVCAPAVAAARERAVPVVLVNLDAVPGKANRHAASRSDRVLSACPVPQGWDTVGPIVRAAFTDAPVPARARAAFGLDPDAHTLLVTGGSLGARSVNDLIAAMLARTPAGFTGWQAIHQCGPQHEPDPIRAAYHAAGVRAWVDRYIDDMPGAWSAADLAIARCGAGTVAEAWASRTPAFFLPFPYHADQHQKHNAEPLADAGAALILDDRIDPNANIDAHADTILGVLTDPDRLAAMRAGADRLGPADGAARVARAVLAILVPDRFSDG